MTTPPLNPPLVIVKGPIRIAVGWRALVIDATNVVSQSEYLPEAHGVLTLSKAEAICLASALDEALKGTRR